MFLMCHNKNDKCFVLNQAILRPPRPPAAPSAPSSLLLLQNISSLNNCGLMLLFLHSLSFFLSLPCWLLPFSFLCVCSHLQRLWSKIISIENPPSTNSMVQSTSSLTLPSLVWSLHDVLHVACHPFIPARLPFSLRPALI